MKRNGLTLLALVSYFFCVQAQNIKQFNNWVFGEQAGATFNTTPPSQFIFSSIPTPTLNVSEGSSSISDTNGVLAFYTDGSKIWNRNHVLMQNGDNLIGNNGTDPFKTSSQGSIIVPLKNGIYYVFTTDAIGGTNEGFRYHVVDMSLAGGLGAVLPNQKNILLLANATEKVTATRHRNGRDYWIVTHEQGSDKYFAYLLPDTGWIAPPAFPNPTTSIPTQFQAGGIYEPVVTAIGPVYTNSAQARGCMKIAPNGRKIATADSYLANTVLCDFNNTTGVLSNALILSTVNGTGFADYGVEFSPDNTKLYVSQWTSPREVSQFNLCAGLTQQAIQNSRVVIGTPPGTEGGQLQLAPDGKIYHARGQTGNNRIGVIENPNALGLACGYNPNGPIVTSTSNTSKSIPLCINSFFYELPPSDFTVEAPCEDSITRFFAQELTCIAFSSYSWNFGDPASGINNTSTEQNPTHQFTAPGDYFVKLVTQDANAIDSTTKLVRVISTPRGFTIQDPIKGDAALCLNDARGYNVPKLFGLQYQWQIFNGGGLEAGFSFISGQNTDSMAAIFSNVDDYRVQVNIFSNNPQCPFDTFSKVVTVRLQTIEKPIGNDTICPENRKGNKYTIKPEDKIPNTTYTWSVSDGGIIRSGQGTDEIIVDWDDESQVEFSVRIRSRTNPGNPCLGGSERSLSVYILPKPNPDLFIAGDSVICAGSSYTYTAPNGFVGSTFTWNVYNGQIVSGQGTDTVEVAWQPQAGGTVEPYEISVFETTARGCKGDEKKYQAVDTCSFFVNAITPNGDGLNEFFSVKNADRYDVRKLEVYNRWGQRLFKTDDFYGGERWKVDELPSGNYYYRMILGRKGDEKEHVGWIQVIR
jgi:gliding motility-associated-like protein